MTQPDPSLVLLRASLQFKIIIFECLSLCSLLEINTSRRQPARNPGLAQEQAAWFLSGFQAHRRRRRRSAPPATGSWLGATRRPWRQCTLQGSSPFLRRPACSKSPQKLRAELDAESEQANPPHTSDQQTTAEVAAKPWRPGVAWAYSAPQNLPGSWGRGGCGHFTGGSPGTGSPPAALTGAGTPPGSAQQAALLSRTAHLLVTTSLPLYGDFVRFSDC